MRLRNSLAVESIQFAGGAVGIPLPITFALDIYESVRHKWIMVRKYSKDEFEEIDRLRRSPHDLLERLPHYLGLDIRRRLDAHDKPVVAFLDGYDRQRASTRANHAPWLQELIASIGSGLYLISTREPLQWDGVEWGDVLKHAAVDLLPEDDARTLVHAQLGAISADVEDRLIEVSRRLPFFLETIVNWYAFEVGSGRHIAADDVPSTPEGAVHHLLDHLETPRRTLAIALATVQVFDERLFAHMSRLLALQLESTAFEEFKSWYFVEPIDHELFKTHDLLTELVRRTPTESSVKIAALDACGSFLLARCHGDGLHDPIPILAVFQATLDGWQRIQNVPTASVERIVDVGYLLYDAGYWNELAASDAMAGAPGHPSTVISRFFGALAARRTTGPLVGLELLGEVADSAAILGRHRDSVDLELAYLSAIAGNYARARQDFRELNDRSVPFDPTDRTHVRARLYHADMLMLDGFFRQAAQLMLEAYEMIGARAPLDWSEIVRNRGHVFRFCFQSDEAEHHYLQAMQAAGDAPALQGKLWTNLAETLCWRDPDRALIAAEESVEMNLRLGNQIELVKCHTARGVAFGKKGETTAALDTLTMAVASAFKTGYPAGAAFGFQAAAVVSAWADDRVAAVDYVIQLRHLLADFGTYGHLMLAPCWVLGMTDEAVSLMEECEWLDPASLERLLTAAVGPFGLAA